MTIIVLLLTQLMSIAVLVDGQNPLSIDLFMRNFTMDKPRGTADARYDLPLYMSGIWEIQMGERSFLNYIWQECLGKQKLIITNNGQIGTPTPYLGRRL